MARVVAVIPARYASQRLPAKPLIDLLGKSMIQRVYEQASKASLLSQVVVATDDDRIAAAVRAFGGEVIMTSDTIRSGSDRVAAIAGVLPADIFVNVQGDEPLIAPQMIDEAVRVVLDDPDADVGTLVRKLDSPADLHNPAVVKVVLSAGRSALYFSRSVVPFIREEADQSLWLNHHMFYRHVGIYVFRRSFLLKYPSLSESALERAERLEQLRILEHGYRIKVGITQFDCISVDTQDDVRRVIEVLKSRS
ncbi:MAG TPA: 3-deoxy-manno-octulosonate cytidylyltransferase [Bacteroidetes bacterium]|nr:MAG: 3-deoxy-manno-octulosonate cytidylyltransferase [Ignavibacteria bacterium GWA2_54_16]HCA81146.1 3-deoxy-manno-octulosonate cytidylyltransferase [Bacteroidota bacterium]